MQGLKLSRFSRQHQIPGIDVDGLLNLARETKGMTSLNMSKALLLDELDSESRVLYILHNESEALACCGVKLHRDYGFYDFRKKEHAVLNNVAELSSLFLLPSIRGSGFAESLTLYRLDTINDMTVVVEARPSPNSTLDNPIANELSLAVPSLALRNGFSLVGSNPTDFSPVYLRIKQ